jgi:hypothetical protein
VAQGKTKWDGYRQQEADEAVKEAGQFIKPIPQEKTSIAPAGRKRRQYNRSDRPPFEGCSVDESDQLRQIVAYKFAGYTQREALENVGLSPTSGSAWITRRSNAYLQAEKEHLESCLRSYQTNLWVCRTALSEIGPRAIKTLAEIMDDKRVSASTRAKVATTILKLVDVDHSATGGANESLAKEFVGFLKEARQGIKGETIVDLDAEEAEVVNDGDNGTDDSLQSD